MRRAVAPMLAMLLLTASLAKSQGVARSLQPPGPGRIGNPIVSTGAAAGEAAAAVLLLSGLWPRTTWFLAVALFSLFSIITAAETIQGKDSCGCFGDVHIRPVNTMCLDLAALALLLITGRPDRGTGEEQNSECGTQNGNANRRRWIVAGGLATAWVAVVGAMWLTRPTTTMATGNARGQDFGKPGELVVLEPEKWAGQKFSLADHINLGSQLATGQWIVLLVHHDCDHCTVAVPRYVAEYGGGRGSEVGGRQERFAVIEMPPFGDADDPAPWQPPPNILSGHLDVTRDWFATTPIALLVKDGIVISGKEADAAEIPDPAWWK